MNLKLVLAAVGIFLTGGLLAQPFGTALYQQNTDYNHYSNETSSLNSEYIFAGTRFKAGNNDVHVFKLDANGAMKWQRIIDLGQDDRALDVVENPNTGEIVVCGYTNYNGPMEFYVVKLSSSGAFLTDNIINSFPYAASAATNVIYSTANDTYVVGGLNASSLSFPLTGNSAVLVELDLNLNLTNNYHSFHGPSKRHASVNDIVEIQGGYFVTGSIDFGFNSGDQGVLAITVDQNLALQQNASFESTNFEHNGVSAVYEDATDEIYLMSNNSFRHNPQITTLASASTTLNITNQYYLALDATGGSYNAAGFELRKSLTGTGNYLVAAGMFKTDYPGSLSLGSNNANMWITEFDAGTGMNVNTVVWDAPSSNFHTHGGGVFSTFQGEHPYIYTQEMLTYDVYHDGYVYVGANQIFPPNYGLSIVSSISIPGASSCMTQLNYTPYTSSQVLIGVNDQPISPQEVCPSVSGQSINDPYMTYCLVNYKREQVEEHKELTVESFQASPNPFNDLVNITIPGEIQDGELTIVNAVGAVVYQQSNLSGEALQLQIDLSEEARGLYFVTVRNGDHISTEKLIRH